MGILPTPNSWVCASMLHGRHIIRKHARWQVRRGDRIHVTEDPWLAPGERIQIINDPTVETVSALRDHNNTGWNLAILRDLFDPSTIRKILQTPIRWFEGNDRIWWPFSASRDYSIKSGYWQIINQEQVQNLIPSSSDGVLQRTWQKIWKAYIPQKMKIFLWKICHNILPVRANLHKRRIAQTNL